MFELTLLSANICRLRNMKARSREAQAEAEAEVVAEAVVAALAVAAALAEARVQGRIWGADVDLTEPFISPILNNWKWSLVV